MRRNWRQVTLAKKHKCNGTIMSMIWKPGSQSGTSQKSWKTSNDVVILQLCSKQRFTAEKPKQRLESYHLQSDTCVWCSSSPGKLAAKIPGYAFYLVSPAGIAHMPLPISVLGLGPAIGRTCITTSCQWRTFLHLILPSGPQHFWDKDVRMKQSVKSESQEGSSKCRRNLFIPPFPSHSLLCNQM